LAAQIALNGAENIYVVVNCQNYWFLHSFSNYNRTLPSTSGRVSSSYCVTGLARIVPRKKDHFIKG
jgi:hypothetical protein